ncbi:MAG: hypothetical protein IPK97_10070 [Ahniella sp.]|nr:hypothetical protein [Ahniella sp.]
MAVSVLMPGVVLVITQLALLAGGVPATIVTGPQLAPVPSFTVTYRRRQRLPTYLT